MPQWTPDEARANMVKGHQAQRDRWKRLKQREQLLDELVNQAADKVLATPSPDDGSYAKQQVVIVREQLDRLHQRLRDCDDDAGCLRLATAIGKLGEYEAQLSNRPGPGNLRPTAPRRPGPAFTPPAEG